MNTINNDNFLRDIKILPTITTTYGSDWRNKIEEINKLGLEEIALFPTCLTEPDRKKLYALVEKSCIKRIPFVHIRSDMKIEELDLIVEHFGTEIMNIHSGGEFPFQYDYSKFSKFIYIENTYYPLREDEIAMFGGICLDFSHLENDRLQYPDVFKHNTGLFDKFPIGCNHISAIRRNVRLDTKRLRENQSGERYDYHLFEEFEEFDYLKKYPLKYFSKYISIELENSIQEQLKVKSYLIKLLYEMRGRHIE